MTISTLVASVVALSAPGESDALSTSLSYGVAGAMQSTNIHQVHYMDGIAHRHAPPRYNPYRWRSYYDPYIGRTIYVLKRDYYRTYDYYRRPPPPPYYGPGYRTGPRPGDYFMYKVIDEIFD